jgi:hypothetical protein
LVEHLTLKYELGCDLSAFPKKLFNNFKDLVACTLKKVPVFTMGKLWALPFAPFCFSMLSAVGFKQNSGRTDTDFKLG